MIGYQKADDIPGMLEGWVSRTSTEFWWKQLQYRVPRFCPCHCKILQQLSGCKISQPAILPYSRGLRVSQRTQCGVTAWENGVASENNNFQFIVEFTIKTSIYRRLSIAKFDYQMDSDGTSMYIPFFCFSMVSPFYPWKKAPLVSLWKNRRWFLPMASPGSYASMPSLDGPCWMVRLGRRCDNFGSGDYVMGWKGHVLVEKAKNIPMIYPCYNYIYII